MKNKISSLLIGSLSYCFSLIGDQYTTPIEKLSESSFNMASKIYQMNHDKALVFSPYSVFSSLAMVYEGSSGDTEKELAKMLSISVPKENLSPLANIWKTYLLANPSLELANALWIQNDFMILPSFQTSMEYDYQAGLYSLDFQRAEEASQTINEWVSEKTHNMIPKFLDASDLNDATRLITMSTLFFKENWKKSFISIGAYPFDTKAGIVFVKMMRKVETCDYAENDQLQMASIPLESGQASLVVVLPKNEESMQEFEEKLSNELFQSLLSSASPQMLHIEMPKFQLKQKTDLAKLFIESGATLPFSENADFSGINGARNLCIDNILHAAAFVLDEQGIKASAVTGTSLGLTSFPIEPEGLTRFIANRPFLFFLIDTGSKTVLMMGKFQPPINDELSH